MLVYILIFLFATFLYFKEDKVSDYILFYAFVITYIIISGLRDMIGGFDVYIYGEVFESTKENILIYDSFEKGFEIYFVILKNISDNRSFMFFATALIMSLLHFKAIRILSPIVYFSLFIFFCKFFLMSFVYLRQGLAMGLVWIAIPHIQNKKYIKFFVPLLIAYFLHKSALIFGPLFFFGNIKTKNTQILLFSILLIVIIISPLGNLLTVFFTESIDDQKLANYSNEDSVFNFFYLIEIILLTVLALNFRTEFYKSKETTVIFNGFLGYILVLILGLTNATFVRFAWYYLIFVAIALPYIYTYMINLKNKQVYKLLVFLYFGLLFFRLLISYDAGDLLPYKTIFQDFERHGRWEYREYR